MKSSDAARALRATFRGADLGRMSSAILATRVPLAVRARFEGQAKKLRMNPGVLLRTIVMQSATPRDPSETLEKIAALLDLDPAIASPDDIQQALTDLLLVGQPSDDGGDGSTGEVADQPPPAAPKALSRAEVAGIKRLGISVEEFRARKRAVVRRAPSARKASR